MEDACLEELALDGWHETPSRPDYGFPTVDRSSSWRQQHSMGSEKLTQSIRNPPDPEDFRLVKLALGGSNEAFDELDRRHRDNVLRFIARMLGRKADAQDLTQQTFLKARNKLRQYKPTHPFRAWIIRIARNTTLDFIQENKRDPEDSWPEKKDFDSKEALQDRKLEIKQLWHRSRELMIGWIEEYMPSEGQKNSRKALIMSLDGHHKDWQAIADKCGYLNKETARVAVYNQITKALKSPQALEAARAIAATIAADCQGLGFKPGTLRFLGLIDLNRIENSNEE